MSHLHRQCCAAFLVRDLRLDWRLGAEHFEACLLDHTPDANWGNWAYRILQRPGLVESRRDYPVENLTNITTMECVAWPAVHDAELEHTLRWVPELAALPRDLAREPWRTETVGDERISVKPYRDSPLWFCAYHPPDNRANWDYEYFWLPGHAWTVKRFKGAPQHDGFRLGRDYPAPLVPPLNLELDLDALPVRHSWGDTAEGDSIWGSAGGSRAPGGEAAAAGAQSSASKGRGKGKGKGKGRGDRAAQLRDAACVASRRRQRTSVSPKWAPCGF
ncbi:unnamed protein product [Prorocentrum cordatum]|uniref:Cryptochrome/DNA photolyase FAD-binding domain-containing protein n=1 Tax=Prorocentrum cordatum TaxID=2364126 RepID=A0ABN9VLZ9_9DINO|nr:unnamed protein product [Polarella glacialis]